MTRLTIFAKGNLDVRDSLHSQKLGKRLVWNGINEILNARHPDCRVRVQHETWTRSDALLAASGTIPKELLARDLPLGAYQLGTQFGTNLFEANPDVFVLSIQPDVSFGLLRHRRDGYLFEPYGWSGWKADDYAWLRASFVSTGHLTPAESMANLRLIIDRLRAHSTAPILIYNLSCFVPGEQVHDHSGLGDLLSTRIRRFNLALIELSQETGISIIDVDTVLARTGAERMKYDAIHLTAEGCRAVTEEVVRVLEDLGCLPVRVRGRYDCQRIGDYSDEG
jgi:hypothetical protein